MMDWIMLKTSVSAVKIFLCANIYFLERSSWTEARLSRTTGATNGTSNHVAVEPWIWIVNSFRSDYNSRLSQEEEEQM